MKNRRKLKWVDKYLNSTEPRKITIDLAEYNELQSNVKKLKQENKKLKKKLSTVQIELNWIKYPDRMGK